MIGKTAENNGPGPICINPPVLKDNGDKLTIPSAIRADGEDKLLWSGLDAAYRD